MNRATFAYQSVQVETASPGQLVVMLYDGAIRSLAKAEAALELEGPNRYENLVTSINSARDILTELSVALDFHQGILSHKLFGLYGYMIRRLSDALGNQGRAAIREVSNMLVELRGAWAEAVSRTSGAFVSSARQSLDISG